jgi:hypothetical protein
MYRPEAPEGPPGRESALFWGEKSPSGDQNEQKGLREGRIAALLPRTLGPGVNEAALLPSPSDLGPDSHANAGESHSTTEPVSRAYALIRPFCSKCTDRVNTEGSVRRGTRVSPP